MTAPITEAKRVTFSHPDGSSIQLYFSNNPCVRDEKTNQKIYQFCVGCGINRFPLVDQWTNPTEHLNWGDDYVLCKSCKLMDRDIVKFVSQEYLRGTSRGLTGLD